MLRLTVSGLLSPPRTTSKSSTHLNRAGPAGISGWQWIGVSGSLCYLLKTSVQPLSCQVCCYEALLRTVLRDNHSKISEELF